MPPLIKHGWDETKQNIQEHRMRNIGVESFKLRKNAKKCCERTRGEIRGRTQSDNNESLK